jgi:hypothetical protein
MRLLNEHLIKEHKAVTFWFDAWQYENENSLLIPLLSLMVKAFKKHAKLIKHIKKSATVLMLTGADVLLKGTTLGRVALEDINKNFDVYEKNVEKNYDRWVGEIDLLKADFEKLIAELKEDKESVIIFIDDLDRCMPENVIKLIENIKHFLSVKECVFILGVDKGVLSRGIQARYGSNLISGDEYLEKIINLSFTIPDGKPANQRNFLLDLFQKMTTQEWFGQINPELDEFVDTIAWLGIQNPRRLRILALRYLMFLNIQDRDRYIREVVIKLIFHREFFHDAYLQKRSAGNIDYVPATGTRGPDGDFLPYDKDELEKRSCKGFAKLFTDDRFAVLRDYTGELKMMIENGFNKSNVELQERIRSVQTAKAPRTEEVLQKLLDSKYKRKHEQYFDLVDFIFSLS